MPKTCFCVLALVFASVVPALAQEPQTVRDREAAYTQVIHQRADKIVATLGVADASKAARVREIIAQQYRRLRQIHDARDAQIQAVKKQAGENKGAADAGVQAGLEEANTKLDKLHKEYLLKLSAELAPEQVDKVKDGMTYGVLPLTYRVYREMLPDLTDRQKAQILAWLIEAREKAMDAGSSKEKHAWFGKYKGKINNYLSATGYDLKKAEQDLAQRRKAPPAGDTR